MEDDECGKLIHSLYGCRPAAQAWEEHYSALLKNHGFKRLKSVPVAFVDVSGVVHGDDFVWEGIDEDLDWVQKLFEDKYELKNRGSLGFGPNDELTHEGITLQGDPRHFDLLQECFGMDDKTKVLTKNGYEDGPKQGPARNGVVYGGAQGVPDDCGSFKLHGSGQPVAAVSREGGLQEHGQAESQ